MQYTDEELSAAFDMGMREDGQAKWNQRHLQAGTKVTERKPEWLQLTEALEVVAGQLDWLCLDWFIELYFVSAI